VKSRSSFSIASRSRARALSRSRPALEPDERGPGAAGRAAGVQGERVRADQLGDRRLELELLHRCGHHALALGVEDHELVGMEAQPDVALAGQPADGGEGAGDDLALVSRSSV
jgi:hypothetical protein